MKTLALSTQVLNGVKPPATKREIIQAMAELKRAQLLSESVARKTAMDSQEALAKAELLEFAMENISKLDLKPDLGCCSGKEIYSVDVRVDFIFANLPKPIQKSLEKYHKLREEACLRVPDLKDIRKTIALQMEGATNPTERIKSLLETPETRKALEKMLKSIEGEKEPAAIDV